MVVLALALAVALTLALAFTVVLVLRCARRAAPAINLLQFFRIQITHRFSPIEWQHLKSFKGSPSFPMNVAAPCRLERYRLTRMHSELLKDHREQGIMFQSPHRRTTDRSDLIWNRSCEGACEHGASHVSERIMVKAISCGGLCRSHAAVDDYDSAPACNGASAAKARKMLVRAVHCF